MRRLNLLFAPLIALLSLAASGCMSSSPPLQEMPTPKAPFSDFRTQKPGARHHITVADLPRPYATKSAVNGPRLVARPGGAWPRTLPGFAVQLFAGGLDNPRLIRTAPNGDLFVAESSPGRIKIFRGVTAEGKPRQTSTFATGLDKPFGIAFYPPGPDPQFVYVANTGSVVRFPYRNGDLRARGPAQTVLPEIPSGGLLRVRNG
jgi:glucose/arabinose dehydrogenase